LPILLFGPVASGGTLPLQVHQERNVGASCRTNFHEVSDFRVWVVEAENHELKAFLHEHLGV
jgi:hypothetical protein